MGFVNLYAGNVAGLAVMLVSNIMMAARFWDGVTDPIVGFVVDKTNGKFYPLDKEKMIEVQAKIADIKAKGAAK